MDKSERIGQLYAGQRWISLNGNFTADELRLIAQQVEESYQKAVKNGSKK
jgi:hypothetical protein